MNFADFNLSVETFATVPGGVAVVWLSMHLLDRAYDLTSRQKLGAQVGISLAWAILAAVLFLPGSAEDRARAVVVMWFLVAAAQMFGYESLETIKGAKRAGNDPSNPRTEFNLVGYAGNNSGEVGGQGEMATGHPPMTPGQPIGGYRVIGGDGGGSFTTGSPNLIPLRDGTTASVDPHAGWYWQIPPQGSGSVSAVGSSTSWNDLRVARGNLPIGGTATSSATSPATTTTIVSAVNPIQPPPDAAHAPYGDQGVPDGRI